VSVTGRSPLVISLAVALGAHVGFFVLGSVVPVRNAFLDVIREADEQAQELVVELDVAPLSPSPPQPAAVVEDEPPSPVSPSPVSPSSVSPESPSTAEDSPPPVAEQTPLAEAPGIAELGPPEPSEPTSPTPPAEAWSLAPEGEVAEVGAAGSVPGPLLSGLGVLAIPGVLAALAPDVASAPAPTQAPRRAEVDRDVAGHVLSETMHHRDQSLGLDQPAARVVASAVADAVRRVPLPDETVATFEVDIAPGGQVIGARVVKANKGERAAWNQALAGAKASLSAKGLALRGEAKRRGATVVVRVESRDLYPAGSKKQLDVQPVCAEEVITDLIEENQRDGDAGKPTKAQPGRDRKFCIPIGLSALGDVSNVGTRMHRVVHTTHEVRIGGKKSMPHELHPINKDAPWLQFRNKKGERPVLPPNWRRKKKEWEKKKRGR